MAMQITTEIALLATQPPSVGTFLHLGAQYNPEVTMNLRIVVLVWLGSL